MGVRPASSAADVFFNAVASVSPKYSRRSLCATITHWHPVARSMPAEISPVKAPSAAQYIFCAPIWMRVPSDPAAAAGRFTNGGQITISACVASATSGRNFSKNATVSAGVLYIFQLPAMMGRRMSLSLSQRLKKAGALADFCAEVFGHGLADIGKRGSHAQVERFRPARPVDQQRNVLAAVIGGRRRRVAAVIGGDDQQILRG